MLLCDSLSLLNSLFWLHSRCAAHRLRSGFRDEDLAILDMHQYWMIVINRGVEDVALPPVNILEDLQVIDRIIWRITNQEWWEERIYRGWVKIKGVVVDEYLPFPNDYSQVRPDSSSSGTSLAQTARHHDEVLERCGIYDICAKSIESSGESRIEEKMGSAEHGRLLDTRESSGSACLGIRTEMMLPSVK